MKEDTALAVQLSKEINQFLTEEIVDGQYKFSQHKLTRRIKLFETHTYPTGKFDTQGNYKYWYDVITSRIESEIKNIDFDTKNVDAYSENTSDEVPTIITNLKLSEYLRTTGQAEEINSAIEEGSGWGNILWKFNSKTGYERLNLPDVYVINQTAENVDETPIVERHEMTSSQVRAKKSVWKKVDEVLEGCGSKTYKSSAGNHEQDTTVPMYEMYERNGEVSLTDLKKYKGITPTEGDDDIYVLAKVIGAGTTGSGGNVSIKYIVFAEELKKKKMSDIYKEYHRSRYKGRWFREGIYELLFDIQIRCNQIGNQLAQGLELASKTVLRSEDNLLIQNILTDLRNGDVLKSKDLQQVSLRMEGFDQLSNEWNRMISLANDITNSREIVQGITPASGTPLGTSKLLNQNAGKLFDFIREKLAIPYTEMFEQWIVPQQIKELNQKEILRLTGDSKMLERLHKLIVDDWYARNLVLLPPHTNEIGNAMKMDKMEELKSRPQLMMKATENIFKQFKPRVSIIITGEQVNLDADVQSLMGFAELETDPIRKTAILEMIARKKGLDFGSLPKSEPQQPQQPAPAAANQVPLQ